MTRTHVRSRQRALVSLALVALGLAGCKPAAPPASAAVPAISAAGVLRATEELAPPFMVQQRLTGSYQGRDAELDCVVQLEGNKLTVLGLTPFGTRAFAIEQQGREVRFQKFVDRDIPVEPANVLYDIHRVFFRGLAPLAGEQQGEARDGVYEGQDHGDLVQETWQDGQLVERRFQSLEGGTNNLVIVSFDGPPAPIVAPHVRLTNVAYGYTLQIETTEQKLLEGDSTLEVQSR